MEKKMGFFEAISQVIRKSFVFKGRARRKEYWSWMLFVALLAIVVSLILSVVVISSPESTLGATALLYVFALVVFFPSLSVTFRRLHDIGRSGWWYGGYYLVSLAVGVFAGLFSVASIATSVNDSDSIASMLGGGIVMLVYGLAAFVYSIVLLVWSFTEGTRGPNKYGDDPKREGIEVQNNL